MEVEEVRKMVRDFGKRMADEGLSFVIIAAGQEPGTVVVAGSNIEGIDLPRLIEAIDGQMTEVELQADGRPN